MPELSDLELLKVYATDHSEAAFGTLVSRHINLVYSSAFRHTSDAHAAQEITQAVFIILAKKAPGMSAKTVLPGWLYETTRLTAANFLRAERRRQQREQEAYMQSTLHEPAEDWVWRQIAPQLDDAMARLGERDRNAIVLRFFENKNLREVGAAIGASEDAAKMRLNRALEKLRKIFSKRGISLTTAIIAAAVSANSVQAAPAGLAMTVAATAAKGAVISSSTLTLIKGALKIMAWTKMKMAAVTAAVVLLSAATTVTSIHYYHEYRLLCPPAQTGRMRLPTGEVAPKIIYGGSRNVVILASDGSLWSWGDESLGWPVLGLANTNMQNTVSLRRIGKDDDWVNVSLSEYGGLGIKSDGTLWGWGGNFNCQLGDGTEITRPTPVPSIPGDDWKQVAAGGSSSFALKNNGTLWAWGNNYSGELGTGDKIKISTNAVQVGISTNWTRIWAGDIQIVGLQKDGSLWFWGSLGGNPQDKKNLLVPTRISADTNWTDVSFGYFTMLAIKSDGTLWSWGLDAKYYTDANDAEPNLTPRQVGAENDWHSISSTAGGFYHLLRKKDGSLWALDASDHRTIKPDAKYKPIALRKIDLNKDIAAYAAGGDSMGIVLTQDGEVWTWGRVLGEHPTKDFSGKDHKPLYPKYRDIVKPWQVSNWE